MVVVVCRGQDGGWNDSKKRISKMERKKWSGRDQSCDHQIRRSASELTPLLWG
jgi:hypothetical protein